MDWLAAHAALHMQRLDTAPLSHGTMPDEVRARLSAYDFSAPQPLEDVLEDVGDMLWRWSEHPTNPRHYGLFRPSVQEVSVIGDALAALYEVNLATWNFSPAASEIERHVLSVIGGSFGAAFADLTGSATAHFTSCGQEANLTGAIVALERIFPGVAQAGLRSLTGDPVFYVSQEAHHSFDKAASMVGLGRDALRPVAVDDGLRLDVQELARLVEQDRGRGRLPFLVVGTAGATSSGVVDPLDEMADFATREGLHFHVDAAWGGAAALSPRLRRHLNGIERADTITCDAHKWYSVATGTGMFFARDAQAVTRAFGVDPAYAPPSQLPDRIAYPFAASLAWSRRFTGLKLFLLFASEGVDGLCQRIERMTALGDALRERLRAAGWRLENDTALPLVCFTHPELEARGEDLSAIVDELKRRGTAWISRTRLANGRSVLRASIVNFRTREEDLDLLLEELGRALGD